jgi:uncharacterized protein YutE (UPF0331/DUF86 family)
MVNINLIAAKLADVTERLSQVRKHRKASALELAADQDARELVAFNLMLSVQGCADIAAHLIADEGWAPASSLAASFRRLCEHAVISESTRESLSKAVGLRNVVAHGYSGINYPMLHTAAVHGVEDIAAFASELAIWLRSKSR